MEATVLTPMEYSVVEDPDEHVSKEALETARRSRAIAKPEFIRMMEKLDTFPRRIRVFVMRKLSVRETQQDLTIWLENREYSVPLLAQRYGMTQAEMSQALDVIELIRQL